MKDFRKYLWGYLFGVVMFVFILPGLFVLICKIGECFIPWHLHLDNLTGFVLGAVFFISGICFLLWSNLFLFKEGQGGPTELFNIAITPLTKYLVQTGPYKYTRNPMVFGAFMLYFSIVIFMNSILGLLVLIMFFIFVSRYLKKYEEPRLLKDFGDEYVAYKQKTSRIIPYIK